jgi:hypothetical protein
MKKVFPLIVVLITLSVVGILFIQMSWINNAIKSVYIQTAGDSYRQRLAQILP